MEKYSKLNRPILFYFIATFFIGIITYRLLAIFEFAVQLPEIFIFVLMMLIGYFGINFGYHRGFSRKSFKMNPIVRWAVLTSAASTGESYHNYHHRYPFDYRNGHKIFHWDPTKWLIFSLSKLKIVSDLKRRQLSVVRKPNSN